MRTEPASLLQSGKALRFGVRQTRICPRSLRSPVTLTSTVGGGALAPVSSRGKRAKPNIRAARLVPESEIKTIIRSEEHTSELQSLMRISYAVFCLNKKKKNTTTTPKII